MRRRIEVRTGRVGVRPPVEYGPAQSSRREAPALMPARAEWGVKQASSRCGIVVVETWEEQG